MTAKILDSKPLDTKTLRRLESDYNIKLPEEYKNFLLKFNGGYPEPNIFSMTMNDQNNDGMIHRFLRVNHDEVDGIYYYLELYKERIPEEFLPIAYDPGSNLILIGISKSNHGKIYFWDHEDEGELVSNNNVYFISNSINKFIGSLREL